MAQSVYLAAPFFSIEQVKRLNTVLDALKSNQTIGDIYIPIENQQEDIYKKYGTLEDAMKQLEWQQATYRGDLNALNGSDVVVAIMDYEGHGMDDGTAFEVGYASAIHKPVFLIDFNSEHGPLNLMLAQAYTGYFKGEDIRDLRWYDFISKPQKNTDREVF